MLAIIVLTLLPIGWAYFEAKLDSSKILKDINITHFPSVLFRIAGALIQSIIFYPISPVYFITVVYQLTLFWIAFEIILNKLRDLHWLYIGNTSDGDKFIRKHFTIVQFFLIKIAILIVSIVLWIFLG